jgi:DNA repair exonuclease SbcCD nuclease subunit
VKILATGDWHPDVSTVGFSRFHDVSEAVHEVTDRAIEQEVDLFLFLGDLANPDSGSIVIPILELAIWSALRLRSHGVDSLWLAGNHDVIEDGSRNTTLSPLRALGDTKDAHIWVVEEPRIVRVERRNERLTLPCLPYTSKANNYGPEVTLQSFFPEYDDFNGMVIASHLMIEGMTVGSETTDMPRGRDVFLPLDFLKNYDCTIFNGHYHTAGAYSFNRAAVYQPGNLERLTFGEEKNQNGCMMAQINLSSR